MSSKTKILFVEHDPGDLELMQHELKKGGINYVSEIVKNNQEYTKAIRNFIPDIILSDFSFPSFDGQTAFNIREKLAPDTPFIFVSGSIGEESSIEYIRNGVTDYALKDKLFTLTPKIKRALKESKQRKQKNKVEQELIQSEKRLLRAQQIAHMGSWELDFATNELLLSAEACRIYGLLPSENRQSFDSWLSLIHPDDLDPALRKIKSSAGLPGNFSFYHRIINKNKVVKHIYSESKVEHDEDGVPISLYGITHDVTEIKLAETERIKITNDLIQRNKELEQFTYIVSHNLRAPLANILGAVDALAFPSLEEAEKNLLNQGLKESVLRLDNILNDLNNILHIKHEVNITKEKVNLPMLVDDIKISIHHLIKSKPIEIKYDFYEIDEFVSLKSYWHSIFYNLIFNSIKYRQPGIPCMIEIKSHRLKDNLELIFSDNGLGIDLQKKGDQVFGLYKRFHQNIEGKGMGLFMVKTQVETLGGKISIRSQVNKGTEFTIQFKA